MIILNKFITSRIFSLSLTSALLTSCSNKIADSGNTIRLLYWQAPTILNPHLAWGAKDFEASRISYEPLASFNQDGTSDGKPKPKKLRVDSVIIAVPTESVPATSTGLITFGRI